MDEFKPEDELKPDPSDRRTGRSRQSSERDNEPQINFDDVDLDADDRRPTRARKARSEEPEVEEEYESDEDDTVVEERVDRRPRKRKKAAHKPASRQYMMMGVGILVLLLLIIGIGSALKAPQRLQASRRRLAKRVSIFPVTPPIRLMRPSQRRVRPLQNKRRVIHPRIFLCRQFLRRRRRDSRLWSLMASNAWKCREI
ncbi:DamX protein [Salmonella enterica subsp. arizonae]|uniref:DamX protein n=1 Tax=Salmonella enterica subsp. arizonae TaxID=59203 RepID=A0A2X4SY53_SALER|nr:DamX protein [Salmonella enterica subsp. arizonae]